VPPLIPCIDVAGRRVARAHSTGNGIPAPMPGPGLCGNRNGSRSAAHSGFEALTLCWTRWREQ
jgi:hypothetical protein